ncbi:hypothetical protein [Lysinibacillus fusiformis]|uniref:hypothetical protein n=1 Tax=Lysinibacillus fusiformis TaxID=28031 RepID=UPI000468AD22|nr:hypothetical protein [Lysinibacillus fusiformis]
MQNQTIVQQAFIKIMEDRIFNVAWEAAKKDEKYIESENKRSITLDLLSESLTTDRQKYLLSELEATWELAERFMQEYVYRQGLQDSRMIHKELNSFGIDVTKESMNNAL